MFWAGGGGAKRAPLCVHMCLGGGEHGGAHVLLGAQMVPSAAEAALMTATFSHGTLSFLDPTPPG